MLSWTQDFDAAAVAESPGVLLVAPLAVPPALRVREKFGESGDVGSTGRVRRLLGAEHPQFSLGRLSQSCWPSGSRSKSHSARSGTR